MERDVALARIAAPQLYLVTFAQASAVGLSARQIRYRINQGAFTKIQPRVVLTTSGTPSFEQRALAACLSAGNDAFATHRTAAKLRGLITMEPAAIDITVPGDVRPRLRTVDVHRSYRLGPSERTTVGAIPVATSARTLAGLAGVLEDDDLERACDEAFRRKLLTPDALLRYARNTPATWGGRGRLERIAAERCGNGFSESELEAMAFTLIRRYRLPLPVRQFEVRVRGRNVRFDLAYPERGVAIELDGAAPHWGRDRWQSDHRRDTVTELAGWRVLRFTYWDVRDDPDFVAFAIATALGLRPTRWKKVSELATR